MTRDRDPDPVESIVGSLLGLALGDAFGAPHEGGLVERAVWRLIGRQQGRLRWTDDTQMSLDLAESLVARGHLDQDDLARRFAASYRWSRGYGPGAAKLLKRVRRGQPWQAASRAIHADGSFGNGAAMRAPVVGLWLAEQDETTIRRAAHATAEITHAHPLAIEAAELIALATALAYRGVPLEELLAQLGRAGRQEAYRQKLARATTWLGNGDDPDPRSVAHALGNGMTALDSSVTAIYLATRFAERSFDELLSFVIALGGDVDTIAAMAGAIWGARRGASALPTERIERIEDAERLESIARALAGIRPTASAMTSEEQNGRVERS